MKFNSDCLDLAGFIADYHQEFNGGHIDATHTAQAWYTLSRAVDFLRKEKAARSVQFPAMLQLHMTKGRPVRTEISISLEGDEVVYTERTIDPEECFDFWFLNAYIDVCVGDRIVVRYKTSDESQALDIAQSLRAEYGKRKVTVYREIDGERTYYD